MYTARDLRRPGQWPARRPEHRPDARRPSAWRKVGPEAWAAFSREADLGTGLVVYPLLGVGAPLPGVLDIPRQGQGVQLLGEVLIDRINRKP